ncbi:acyltransferase family protein [Enterococcus casseliflavus]|uniref:acyltransferase family protein n=1 Tax=Enterococcus casseliflavus TaxID=37734 RepID=UPI0022E2C7A0|nr:acyltransferase family protein [Enterococcus casseliflavus]
MVKRLKWIDFSKGIGIISIVLGHTYFPYSYLLFLFHVPLFFLISGILYKNYPVNSLFFKRVTNLIIPYFILGGVCILVYGFFINQSLFSMFKDYSKLFYSGNKVIGVTGAYWFIPVLIVTEVICSLLLTLNKKFILFLLCLAYMLFHWVLFDINLILNLAILPITIIFFVLGYYMKRYMVTSSLLFFSTFVCLISLILHFMYQLDLEIDLKNRISSPIILDILTPMSISFIIFKLGQKISTSKSLVVKTINYIGANSLIIMLVHNLFINILVYYDVDNWLIQFLVSIFLSTIISKPLNLFFIAIKKRNEVFMK